MTGHKRVWAQTCVGTNVCGHKRVWAQTCLGTIVCEHNRVGSIMYGHKRGGTGKLDRSGIMIFEIFNPLPPELFFRHFRYIA